MTKDNEVVIITCPQCPQCGQPVERLGTSLDYCWCPTTLSSLVPMRGVSNEDT